MAETWQKEQISRAFVDANIASAKEGMTVGTWDVVSFEQDLSLPIDIFPHDRN